MMKTLAFQDTLEACETQTAVSSLQGHFVNNSIALFSQVKSIQVKYVV